MEKLPKIAITSGDIAGIGPEIAVKAAASEELKDICIPILVGPANIFLKEAEKAGINISALQIENTGDFTEGYEYGKIDGRCGMQAYLSAKRSAEMAMDGRTDAIATSPLNKESLRAAGLNTIGYTEMLADLAQIQDPVTIFKTHGMLIFFLSRHLSLKTACEYITFDTVLNGIMQAERSLKLLGISDEGKPLAVAGLNPHNGEHGLFGNEEQEHISPAIKRAVDMGINVEGPVPADSVFYLTLKGRYSAVLSLYHDQGHIAAKTLDFLGTVSLTTGMPFLRTSVDHGTAFDIAGKGIAEYVSLIEAVKAAALYGVIYRKNQERD